MRPTLLVVNVFVGAHNLPLLVAQERGTFERSGIAVELVRTASSTDQMRGLIEGQWPIVHTSPDNLLAWGQRQGRELVAWLGGSVGPLALVAQPGLASAASLRGKTLAVDALESGFTFALRAMLQAQGLRPTEYRLEAMGATNLRWQALREGRALATLLNLPFSLLARDAGYALLGTHLTAAPRLLTSVAGSTREWLLGNAATATAYARVMGASLAWLYDPANRPAAWAILRREFSLSAEVAAEVAETLLDPYTGFLPTAYLDVVGLQRVVDLRAEATGWRPANLAAWYDLLPSLGAAGATE